MPAYRSDAEADIRGPVTRRLREIIPGCRIIHEINAASFGNRIDVLAVGASTLAAVEIKSERDKLDRLPEQIAAMRRVSNLVYAALHERFLRDSSNLRAMPPNEAKGAVVWVYPVAPRKGHLQCGPEWCDRDRWQKPVRCLPRGALGLLWRDELHSICRDLGCSTVSRLNMPEAQDIIRWSMNGEQIARAICAALRARDCVEADPPLHLSAGAA